MGPSTQPCSVTKVCSSCFGMLSGKLFLPASIKKLWGNHCQLALSSLQVFAPRLPYVCSFSEVFRVRGALSQ